MQEREAIEKIIELSEPFKSLGTETPAVVTQGGNKIESIEHLMKLPSRFKSVFSTTFINDFIEYCSCNAAEHSSVYLDTVCFRAKAIFDHGSSEHPEWGEHQAKLDLLKEPAYYALISTNTKNLSQVELIDFLEDWKESVTFYDMPFTDGVNRIRRVTINRSESKEINEGDFKSSASAMEQIAISSGGDSLPTGFIFKTSPFDSFSPIEFECRIIARPSNEERPLRFRINRMSAIEAEIGKEFMQKIQKEVSDMRVYLGSVTHR